MSRSRLFYCLSALLVGCWLVLAAVRFYTQTQPQGYTIERTVRLYGPSGRESVFAEVSASRADGAVVTRTAAEDSDPVSTIVTPEPPQEVKVDYARQIKTTTPIKSAGFLDSILGRAYQGTNCSEIAKRQQGALLGEERYLDVPVAVYGLGGFVPSQGRHEEIRKMAPSLNCFALYRDIIWVNKDGVLTSRTTYTATQVRIGTPDPELFHIPANAREVKPSEFYKARAPNNTLDPCLEKSLAKRDEVYERTRRP